MAVNPGSIAFVGANSDNPDQVSFVVLANLVAGDTFFITDNGFISVGASATATFRSGEGIIQYTVPAGGLTAGSVIVISADGAGTAYSAVRNGGGAGGTVTNVSGGTTFALSTSGDQITAYTTSDGTQAGAPTLIAFADFGTAPAGALTSNTSNTPTIANGQVLDLVNEDNFIFTDAANAGTASLAQLNTAGNFTQSASILNQATLISAAASPFTAGNDSVVVAANGTPDDYDGLGGFDELNFTAFTGGVSINTTTTTGTINSTEGGNDTVTNVEFFNLGSGNDLVTLGNSVAPFYAVRAGGGTDTVTGGTAKDLIDGGAGNDTLSGGTGAANEMAGGLGDDVFIVAAVGDTIIEAAGEGTDRVETALDRHTLRANVENLTFTGSTAFIGIGNAENNQITGGVAGDTLVGGAGNDVLSGGSGAANSLIGGTGDDTFIVSTNGDTIVEAAGEGTDNVQSSGTLSRLGANVENLSFTSTTNNVGFGNAEANVIVGNAGNDILHGLGGVDTLTGGAGSDLFFFDGSAGTDTITDFTSADNIFLEDAVFQVQGSLQFVANGPATTSDSTILFNSTTGLVQFDADGNGAGAAVDVVILANGATITAGDVFFY